MQTAAQRSGRLDEAHALIVRPNADGFEIISGHHRMLAAERAGLAEVALLGARVSLQDRWSQLAEIHAAPRWLWRALVSAMAQSGGARTPDAIALRPTSTKAAVPRGFR